MQYENHAAQRPLLGFQGKSLAQTETIVCYHDEAKFLRIREDNCILRNRLLHALLSWKKTGSGPNVRHLAEKIRFENLVSPV